jgi:hypothetical protein
MNAPLVLRDFAGKIEVTSDAYELKRKAIKAASAIAKVETPEQQIAAVAALREVKSVINGMEQTRKAVKSPVLALGKEIDATAHGFIQEVDKQYGRLTGLINHYQKKLAREKAKEELKIQQEERTAAQLREQAANLRASATNKYTEAEACKLEQEAFDLEMNTELAVVPRIEKPKGLVVRNRINFQVEKPIVFCQAWPDFWRWHEETETLKLDRMRILEELNKESGDGCFHKTRFPEELSKSEDRRLVRPAGLRVYEETKAHIR